MPDYNKLAPFLICPLSGDGPLHYDAERQVFFSAKSNLYYPIVDGVVRMLPDSGVGHIENKPVTGMTRLESHEADFWGRYQAIHGSQHESQFGSEDELMASLERHNRIVHHLYPYYSKAFRFPLVKGKVYAEIGIGQGELFGQYCKEQPGIAIGVDASPASLAVAAIRASRQKLDCFLIQADARNLPLASDAVDFVMSNGVIHHIPETELAAKEIVRIMAPDGKGIVMVYHKSSWWYFVEIHLITRIKAMLLNNLPRRWAQN